MRHPHAWLLLPIVLIAFFSTTSPTLAQCQQGNSTLTITGHPATGNLLAAAVTGPPGALGLFAVDIGSGPVSVPGAGTVCLSLSPNLLMLPIAIPPGGTWLLTSRIPPWFAAVALALQAAVTDVTAPNGNFALTNGWQVTANSSTVLFSENFSGVPLGTCCPGLWQLLWGASSAVIAAPGSGGNALQLVSGGGCWSRNAYHPVSMATKTRFEVRVYVPQVMGGGCSDNMAVVAFWSPPASCACTWGASWGDIEFLPTGTIRVGATGPILRPYSAATWYRIALIADFAANTFDVEIDDSVYFGFPGYPSVVPTGILLEAGHGTPAPTLIFDDVIVSGQ